MEITEETEKIVKEIKAMLVQSEKVIDAENIKQLAKLRA
jgi:hypothetical protein